jgi:hypothetical protein
MRTSTPAICLVLLAVGSACEPQAGSPEARRVQIEAREARSRTPGEALDRKQRSHVRLAADGVPILQSLPVIETEAESRRRTAEEVTQRALGVSVVAALGLGLGREPLDRWIHEFGVQPFFTPAERAFLAAPAPSRQDLARFSWRFESACVLLWAVGYIDDLGRPDKQCDPEVVQKIVLGHGPRSLFEHARLRPQRELLDAADLVYRYHWAVTEARIHDRAMPAGLDADVVMERHYALNWLIGYEDQEWDDVSTDT